MSSQFTAQSLSDYLSAVSAKDTEDQNFVDSQKQIMDEFKLRGQEMLGTSIIPTIHMIKGAYTKVSKFAENAENFKNKVQTAGKQISELPEKTQKIIGNKVDEVGDNVVDKLKTTASKKLGGLVEEAKGQGASLEAEPVESLGSMLENSRLGNVYKRFKSVTTSSEDKAKSLQQAQFEEDPEAGIQEMRPEPMAPEPQAKIPVAPEAPKAPPTPEEAPPAPEEGGQEMTDMSGKTAQVAPETEEAVTAGEDVGKTVGKTIGETAGKVIGSEAGELVGEGVASLIPGAGEVLDAGLLLFQGIEGLKDLFHKPQQELNQPTPSFQAGI
jgi:hypothetical protein